MTSRHVTVALNGDGGDESFAGYRRYISSEILAQLGRLPRSMRLLAPVLVRPLGRGRRNNSMRARIDRLARVLAVEPHARYAHWMSAFPALMREEMLQQEFLASTGDWRPEDTIACVWLRSTAQSGLERMLDTDVNTYLPDDLLVKMDIATMAYSVEARSPFLDHHLMEFAAKVPARLKLHRRSGKVLLKYALRGIVPDEILDRAKMGFGVPLPQWFRKELRSLPAEVLLGADARVQSYVKPEAIRRMIKEHQARQADHSQRLWALLQLELWHREVVELPRLAEAPAGLGHAALAQPTNAR